MARLPDSLSPRERARVRAPSARLSVMAILLLALFGSLAAAAAGGNLALGRPYTMAPAPSYGLCSDAGDAVQLTDGKPAGAGCFWTQPAAVGWASVNPITVTVDLGSVQAIGGVAVGTASRLNAGVRWPTVIVAVSDDGTSYHRVGRLLAKPVAGQVDSQEYRQALHADDLQTRGRYVIFFILPGGPFVFLDEVEVLGGDHDPAQVRFTGGAVTPDDLRAYQAYERRLGWLAARCRELAGELTTRRQSAQAAAFGRLTKRIAALPPGREEAAAAWREVAAQCARANAALQPGRRLVAWVADPWAALSPFTLLPSRRDAGLRLDAAAGEFSSAAVSLTNTTTSPLRLQCGVSMAAALQPVLRQVRFVESAGGQQVADALPGLADGRLVVPPGETSQLWLTFPQASRPAGDYRGTVTVSGGGQPVQVPIRLRVYPVKLPADMALQTYHWDYVNTFGLVKGLQREAVADLTAHYTNTYVFSGPDLPWPTFDAQGQGKIDFTAHDRNLALHHGAREVSWFWGLGRNTHLGARFGAPLSSEEGRRRFAWWLRAWVEHLQELGYGYDRFFMYPYDETLCPEFQELAALIKQVDPRVRIFADPVADDTTDMIKAIAPSIDIWCPHLATYEKRPADLDLMRAPGKKLWTYECSGPAKTLSPLGYYRLQAWRAWRLGMTGCGFWAYADAGWTGDDAWDDFDGTHHDYAVVYAARNAPPGVPRTEAIIPSKRWEAWREGIEDYQLLTMAKQRADKLGDTAQGKALHQAIDRAVSSVLAGRTTAMVERARRTLLQALAQRAAGS